MEDMCVGSCMAEKAPYVGEEVGFNMAEEEDSDVGEEEDSDLFLKTLEEEANAAPRRKAPYVPISPSDEEEDSHVGVPMSLCVANEAPYVPFIPSYRAMLHEEFLDDGQHPLEIKIDTAMLLEEFFGNITSIGNPHPRCSIYMVPADIRDCDPEAYTPKVVSIGPYHYRKPTIDCYKDMQDYKCRCLHSFISRDHHHQSGTNQLVTRECLTAIKKHEEEIKSYYSHPITTSYNFIDNEFALLMLLDGCFILHLLLTCSEPSQQPADMYMPGRLWIWALVKRDLLLLENQIPFFIVKELQDILGNEEEKKVDLVQRALGLFQDIELRRDKDFSIPGNKVHHLLHLFYVSLLPPHPSHPLDLPPKRPPPQMWIPSATELTTEFGARFEANNAAISFLNVNFSRKGIIARKGVMQIPPLLIDDDSKGMFRNLIAFEQCYPYTNYHIVSYIAFMSDIISTEADVRLLHLKKILTNRMSDDQEPTHFFSQLSARVHFPKDRFYLDYLFRDVGDYQEDSLNKCIAGFKLQYCSNAWAIFAAVVSVIFFILTIVQTFFTIFP